MGEEQAGHIKMIGAALHQRLMAQAVRSARGEQADPDWTPELQPASIGTLCEQYIPDATVRINLYARLARLSTAGEVDAFEEELEDRFGPLPDRAAALISNARLQVLARSAGVRRVTQGPLAVAFDLAQDVESKARALGESWDSLEWRPGRLIQTETPGSARDRNLVRVLEALSN